MLDGLNTLLSYFRDERHKRTAQQDDALRAVYKAVNETKLYIDRVRRTGAPDRATEEQLSRFWTEAAVPVRHLDSSLAERCLTKSEYWVNPSAWSEPQIEDFGIDIDAIHREALSLLRSRNVIVEKKLPSLQPLSTQESAKNEEHSVVPPANQTPKIQREDCRGVALSEYTARDICVELRLSPPLQRKARATAFRGWRVDWELKYSDANQNGGTAKLYFNPWEDEGYDTLVRCDVSLADYPNLYALSAGAILRVSGKIDSASEWDIDLIEARLTFLSPKELQGTRLRSLTGVIRRELGFEIAETISNRAIDASLRSQIDLGRLEGYTLANDSVILPELPKNCSAYKLLVLKTCKHILESNAPKKSVRDKLFSLENEIYELESGAGFHGW